MEAKLVLEDGTEFVGESFGYETSVAGEVVFSTGMVGYPESLTDPSYQGQILIFTYPLIGNYGVPHKTYWESDSIKVAGLIVSSYIDTPSHPQSEMTLASWLKKEHIPALQIKDTRYLAKNLREEGSMLGKIVFEHDIPFVDPNKRNLVAEVSTSSPRLHLSQGVTLKEKPKTVVLIDCGVKKNIERCLLKRGVNLIVIPWDFDPFVATAPQGSPRGFTPRDKPNILTNKFDALVISNGPGDPKMADITIETVKKAMNAQIPILGICLGNQILALAAGGETYKLKFGHRSQNQPCLLSNSHHCYLTTQNHGYAVGDVPKGFKPWFININDNTNEGIIHETLPFMSVQFHPESFPGPMDTEWIFDYFLEKIKN